MFKVRLTILKEFHWKTCITGLGRVAKFFLLSGVNFSPRPLIWLIAISDTSQTTVVISTFPLSTAFETHAGENKSVP